VDAAVAADTAATFRKNVLRSTGFTETSGEYGQNPASGPASAGCQEEHDPRHSRTVAACGLRVESNDGKNLADHVRDPGDAGDGTVSQVRDEHRAVALKD
jgi:hypothetical protein